MLNSQPTYLAVLEEIAATGSCTRQDTHEFYELDAADMIVGVGGIWLLTGEGYEMLLELRLQSGIKMPRNRAAVH